MTTNTRHQRPLPAPRSSTRQTTRLRLSGESRWLKPLAILCVLVNAVLADTFGLFTYTDNGTKITITDYPDGEVGAVAIPASIIGKPVTSIGSNAFSNCTGLTGVTIPAGVTSIGMSAFSNCTGLTQIQVDAGNPNYSSSDGVFFTKSKASLIVYPAGKVGPYTVPNSVTGIGSSAFYGCSGLTSVVIPNGVTSIGVNAFTNCTGLTGVTIPAGVTSIGMSAFFGCTGLTGVTIPDSVTSMGLGVFDGCISLTGVTIPNSVTSIEYRTFAACRSLTSVTIPGSVTSIGQSAFQDCWSLTSVTIPGSVTSIGFSAFQYCWRLKSVDIRNGVTSVRDFAFSDCTGLEHLRLPASLTNIGTSAFEYCTGLKYVTIPASVHAIPSHAFFFCNALTGVAFLGDAPALGANAFLGTNSGFTVYYLNGKAGFTSPSWNGYPAVKMGNPDPASMWLLSNGFPYDANLQADPNGDGVSLLMAYALNLDPYRNLSGCIPRPVLAGNQISLTFYAGSAGVTYTVQSSADLKVWSTAGVTVSAPDANKYRTATVAMVGPHHFMRLLVEQ
ncbi:MAG: leucine-rich repeat domain-containing protein [Verrucomicrobia bacterium]|nr:leucine-rich repeat domain-containing protein [Verrucomicrobiota bacterium]